eukprot:scaffold154269_cov15-Tisochrysis_lutea.AAC.1
MQLVQDDQLVWAHQAANGGYRGHVQGPAQRLLGGVSLPCQLSGHALGNGRSLLAGRQGEGRGRSRVRKRANRPGDKLSNKSAFLLGRSGVQLSVRLAPAHSTLVKNCFAKCSPQVVHSHIGFQPQAKRNKLQQNGTIRNNHI